MLANPVVWRARLFLAGGRRPISEVPMITRVLLAVVAALVVAPTPVLGQTVRDVFDKVSPSVVVIRGRGRDVNVNAGGSRTSSRSALALSCPPTAR
jgi:hypothetical protein